jgi:hypothetical protein
MTTKSNSWVLVPYEPMFAVRIVITESDLHFVDKLEAGTDEEPWRCDMKETTTDRKAGRSGFNTSPRCRTRRRPGTTLVSHYRRQWYWQ